MPRLLSATIPFAATAFTLAAFGLPWWSVLQGGTAPSLIPFVAVTVLLAMVGLAYLGSVRWRDLEKIENAWSVTTRVGRRSMPADRLRASAGWGVTTLHRERYWGRSLNGSAAALRWLVPILAAASLLAGLACLALVGVAAVAPDFTEGLAVTPGWTDALVLALPALLWPAARMHLPRLPHAEVPSDDQINTAQVELMDRLTEPRLQAGTAAMSAVDHGLDGVFALAERFGALAPRDEARSSHELVGLSDMPGELVGTDGDR